MADHQVTIWQGQMLSPELILGLRKFLSQALKDNRRIIVSLTEQGRIRPDLVDKQRKLHEEDRNTIEPS